MISYGEVRRWQPEPLHQSVRQLNVEASVPDDKWSRAVEIVTEIAGRNGFGAPQTLVDTPGHHQISIRDGYGAEVSFGTRVNTSMLILTGCHLTAEAHARHADDHHTGR